MNAEIIAVGSELLLGQIVNTNAKFLSQQLAEIGINVFHHTVVGDNPDRLKSVLEIAETRSNLIIFTGGLGPTKDDLTKETIANHLGKQLVLDEYALTSIENYFHKTNRVMTNNNRKQALILEGSHVLQNNHGMAPGMLLSTDTHSYMLLPGPPKEMEPMFLQYGQAALLSKLDSNEQIFSRVLRFFGIGEATLETEIEDLIDEQKNPTIAPLASDGEVTLRLTAKHELPDIASSLIDGVEKKILSRVGDYFYGYDQTSLMEEVFKKLQQLDLTLACAESLTGGMFQQQFTHFPGAGNILKGGIVCYTNEVKENILKVNRKTIAEKGVVSEECASELAENVRKLLGADVGVSFTGVAGPGELEGKPVGTVFIGVSINGKTKVEKFIFAGSREQNRIRAVKHGSHLLLKMLS